MREPTWIGEPLHSRTTAGRILVAFVRFAVGGLVAQDCVSVLDGIFSATNAYHDVTILSVGIAKPVIRLWALTGIVVPAIVETTLQKFVSDRSG